MRRFSERLSVTSKRSANPAAVASKSAQTKIETGMRLLRVSSEARRDWLHSALTDRDAYLRLKLRLNLTTGLAERSNYSSSATSEEPVVANCRFRRKINNSPHTGFRSTPCGAQHAPGAAMIGSGSVRAQEEGRRSQN